MKDLRVELITNELVISKLKYSSDFAQIGSVNSCTAELFLGKIFYKKKINNEYLIQLLYHEFTHITDRLNYFVNMKDEKRRINLLFPYSEFHATQIELCKKLDIFHNPQRTICKSTMIYDIYGLITLENFLEDCIRELQLRVNILKNHSNLENVKCIVYTIVYNLGYYSICQKYNIKNKLLDDKFYENIRSEIYELKELLMNTKPSDKLCETTNKIINDITNKILEDYNICI